MSRTTKKYGKPRYSMHLAMDAKPQPTDTMVQHWAYLDSVALGAFSKKYDTLNDKQKSELHYNLNSGFYKVDPNETVSN